MITEKQAVAAVPKRPSFIRDYVRWAARSTDANVAYHIVAAITLLAQAVPLDFSVPFGRPVHTNIFGLLIGPSTLARKTAAISLAESVLQIALPENVGEQPGSPEGLIDALCERPQQLIFWGEYGAFLAGAERGYQMPIKTRLTEAYDSNPIGRKKANGKGVRVDNPRLSILAGVAPGYAERHSELVDWTEGFFARHLTVFAQRERYFAVPSYDPVTRDALAAMLRGYADPHRTMTGGPGPCQGFSKDAQEYWTTWQHAVERLAMDSPHRPTAPALGRAPMMALKVAALLAFDFGHARNGGPWHIELDDVVYATRIVDLHIASVLEIGDRLAVDRDMRDRRRLLAEIGRKPIRFGAVIKLAGFTKRRAKELLETLQEEGTVRQVKLTGVDEPCLQLVPDDERPEAHPEAPVVVPIPAADLF